MHFHYIETLHIVNGDTTPIGPEEHLQKWLLLFPDNITAQIDAALRQERPFLPPDVTPEMMAVKNNKVSSMTQMEVLYVRNKNYCHFFIN